MKRSFNPWILVMIIVLGIFVFNQFNAGLPSKEISYSTFIDLVSTDQVESVKIQDNIIQGSLRSSHQVNLANGNPGNISSFKTVPVRDEALVPLLKTHQVDILGENPSPWVNILFSLQPLAPVSKNSFALASP